MGDVASCQRVFHVARIASMARAVASGKPKALSSRMRRAIENLSPYQSLALLAVPACIVELMKLAAVAITGEGHWFTGTVVIIAAYGASLLLVERLFVAVKPKLLKLRWFARLWSRVLVIRRRLMKPLRSAS
jgi:hypothetical protein